jgi:FAD/FMN-containing dehydrogenase
MYSPFATVEKELRSQLSGDVWFDVEMRTEYSTATCMVKVMPVGVVTPKNIEDVRHVVRVCAENDVAVIPRGGGSCLVGLALDPQSIFNPQKIIGRQDRAFLHGLKYA